ncbi:MAG: hypothetical protein ACI9YH_003679 [Colwellia sp.]|jgi:hypothetical protein
MFLLNIANRHYAKDNFKDKEGVLSKINKAYDYCDHTPWFLITFTLF